MTSFSPSPTLLHAYVKTTTLESTKNSRHVTKGLTSENSDFYKFIYFSLPLFSANNNFSLTIELNAF